MKNSILIFTLNLFILSCGNQPTPDESLSLNNMEKITPKEIQDVSTKNNMDDTITEEIMQSETVIKTEVLDENEFTTKEKLVENQTKLLNETKIIETEISAVPSDVTIEEPVTENVSNSPNHDSWSSILKNNVSSSGKVNYVGMKSNLNGIESYISNLESLSDQSTWSKNEKLAYWINLYNAATVRLIVQNYPTSSITNINGGKPWDKKVVTISGKTYSLNQIENDIIRPKFNEPRIHFAVNCAAISCPKIMNSAFTAAKLDYQLTNQARSFINGSKNSITENSIEISKIFEWYAVDFGSSIIDYLNTYSTTTISSDATTVFKTYNWDLNK